MPGDRNIELETISPRRFPPAQRVEKAEDLAKINFVEDMAEVDVPVGALDIQF